MAGTRCSPFFFSSRRRHTRLQGDWSSDVCSSDLRRRWLLAKLGIAFDVLAVDIAEVVREHEAPRDFAQRMADEKAAAAVARRPDSDRKSTRLNSSHLVISYAVFCLKKKNTPPSSQPGVRAGPRGRPSHPHPSTRVRGLQRGLRRRSDGRARAALVREPDRIAAADDLVQQRAQALRRPARGGAVAGHGARPLLPYEGAGRLR